MGDLPKISVVIPVYNEQQNIEVVVDDLLQAIEQKVQDFEIILVDDGSKDNTVQEIEKLSKINSKIKLVKQSRNSGQGIALFKGIENAMFPYIATLDGDFQFYGKDIIECLNLLLSKNLDFVCGRRKNRSDDQITKKIPSILGNKFISFVFGTNLSDVGCSLKVVKAEYIKNIESFKNCHRYVNLFIIFRGAKFLELEIDHRARKYGKSKYTFLKFFRVLFEVFWIKLFYKKRLTILKNYLHNDQAKT